MMAEANFLQRKRPSEYCENRSIGPAFAHADAPYILTDVVRHICRGILQRGMDPALHGRHSISPEFRNIVTRKNDET